MSYTNQTAIANVRLTRFELEKCRDKVSNRAEIDELIRNLTVLEQRMTVGVMPTFSNYYPQQQHQLPPNSDYDFRARAIARNFSSLDARMEAQRQGLDPSAALAAQEAIERRDYFEIQEAVGKHYENLSRILNTSAMTREEVMMNVSSHLASRNYDPRLIPEITREITKMLLK